MSSSYNPNVYVLGAHPELRIETTDISGDLIIPLESRLSVKAPDGTIVTYSGGDLTLSTTSGYLYLIYAPETIGWYEYEAWVKDGTGREDAATRGFEVIDRVY